MTDKERPAKFRERRRAAGLCIQCSRPSDGKDRCPLCRERENARQALLRSDPGYRAAVAAKRMERYYRLKAAGLCIKCEAPVDPSGQFPIECAQCGSARKTRQRAWYVANRAEVATRVYTFKLKAKYGLTRAEYEQMIRSQGGRCAICRADRAGGEHNRWHVDHNHATGKVRGLLCNKCNVGLGYFNDDPMLLQRAARYVVIKGGTTDERQAPLVNTEGS